MLNNLNHVAIIMDGNGRWAKKKGLERVEGHRRGLQAASDIIEYAATQRIKHLTLYAFSSENWKRPAGEVAALMDLFMFALKEKYKLLKDNNIKLQVIGNTSKLNPALQLLINNVVEQTKGNTGLNLNLAVSYGGREEILRAVKNLVKLVTTNKLTLDEINEDIFEKNLYNPDSPYPDIVIRTGGDYRISNFLLWQVAYSELFFIEKYWPDFTSEDLEQVISQFRVKERRYGA